MDTESAVSKNVTKPPGIASDALLTHTLGQQCDLAVADCIWTGGDCHIDDNHTEQVQLQRSRAPQAHPTLHIQRSPQSIIDHAFEDFDLRGYEPHPPIQAPVAV